ncbi:hypothetical protein BGZ75_010449, partial [Mortierella antarctica]
MIAYCGANLESGTKVLLMSKFKAGAIRILLSAEEAEAVMARDVSDILRVIQFRFLKNISILADRLALQFATQVFKALHFDISVSRRPQAYRFDLGPTERTAPSGGWLVVKSSVQW